MSYHKTAATLVQTWVKPSMLPFDWELTVLVTTWYSLYLDLGVIIFPYPYCSAGLANLFRNGSDVYVLFWVEVIYIFIWLII